jgi:hypothetical protein
VKINSTCTVFAGAELRDRLALGERARTSSPACTAPSSCAPCRCSPRSGGVHRRVHLHRRRGQERGGGAALRQLVKENYGERTLNISTRARSTPARWAAPVRARAPSAGGGLKEMTMTAPGIDVGSGAVKDRLFRVEGGKPSGWRKLLPRTSSASAARPGAGTRRLPRRRSRRRA